VALVGPRQCGKTTLARQIGGEYFDMEGRGGRVRLDAEWDAWVSGTRRIIIDEAQAWPELFPRLRAAIDADRKRNGRFLLLGSVSPALAMNVSESLAGRLAVVPLSPLLLPELDPGRMDDLWLRGGFPDGGILSPSMCPEWQDNYLGALAARDLPAWGLPARASQTLRLMGMLAAVHGQPLNASQLGASLALDHKTVVRHCDLLEGAFLIRRLPPFSVNTRKRLVKTPRVYWRDSGLLHALLGATDRDLLYRQPWLGHSWEGFVIEQTLSTLDAVGQRVSASYFRTSDGLEADLVIERGGELQAVEIKFTSDPSTGDVDRLTKAADLIGARQRALICRVARPIESDRLLVTNPADWLRRITGGWGT